MRQQVTKDLHHSAEPLLITGYAGLEELVGLLAQLYTDGQSSNVRVLIGVEPGTSVDLGVDPASPRQEIVDYWLSRGVSLLNSRALLATVAMLEAGGLSVRSSGTSRVHAKIYVGGAAATLGSSNFTRPGLERNLEANARFERSSEPERYGEVVDLAENLWATGADYTERFAELLRELLRKVTWQEALARACSELLEGAWTPRRLLHGEQREQLWPSQEKGIAQALWVLENQGAVLIADATGSGKTRMGAHLLRVLQDRNWRMGRARLRYPMVLCPPTVRELWDAELADAAESAGVFSHGVLRTDTARPAAQVRKALEKTRILAVDEAHNFLNRMSQRTRVLYGNVADNVILLTATPINKGARDLLGVIELLGADNFAEDILEVVAKLGRAGRAGGPSHMSADDKQRMRSALQEFVVRRTKDDFNSLVDQDPARYVNALGQECRYPEHEPVVFPRTDPDVDCQRAFAIREKAKNLRGLVNLRKELKMPRFLRHEGWTEDRFLVMRLRGASALAGYQIRSRLRSSRVAMIEHILGTEKASARFGIGGLKPSDSGNVLRTLRHLAGRPPKIALDAEVPAWLSDAAEHRKAVEEEIAVYEDILVQAEQMSDHRMEANAAYLTGLLERHPRVLAFDSHLISLYDLQRRLGERDHVEVVLATGERGAQAKRTFAAKFGLTAENDRVVGLCSDALAEGLNLQGASAVVHLDLPTVIRVLEQRIGRVDRMDTPHRKIEVHWPQEPREFRLRTDERLFGRLREVEDLLGSNVPIPAEFEEYEAETGEYLDVQDVIERVERGAIPETSITLADAFSQVRQLVSGEEAIIPLELYDGMRGSRAKVLSSVAVVPARDGAWTFLAVGATERTVPHWILVDAGAVVGVERTLDGVVGQLRVRLGNAPPDLDFDERADSILTAALRAAAEHSVELLSRRKQVALNELHHVATRYLKDADQQVDPTRSVLLRYILRLLDPTSVREVDAGAIADWWLQLIRPEWYRYLTGRRVKRPARLRHLRKSLLNAPLSTERLKTLRDVTVRVDPLDRRIVAAIVGVPADMAAPRT